VPAQRVERFTTVECDRERGMEEAPSGWEPSQ
jgi:hypothetical protein